MEEQDLPVFSHSYGIIKGTSQITLLLIIKRKSYIAMLQRGCSNGFAPGNKLELQQQ